MDLEDLRELAPPLTAPWVGVPGCSRGALCSMRWRNRWATYQSRCVGTPLSELRHHAPPEGQASDGMLCKECLDAEVVAANPRVVREQYERNILSALQEGLNLGANEAMGMIQSNAAIAEEMREQGLLSARLRAIAQHPATMSPAPPTSGPPRKAVALVSAAPIVVTVTPAVPAVKATAVSPPAPKAPTLYPVLRNPSRPRAVRSAGSSTDGPPEAKPAENSSVKQAPVTSVKGERPEWKSKCWFSVYEDDNGDVGCTARDDKCGPYYQTEWYCPWVNNEQCQRPSDLKPYKNNYRRYRNICARCHASYRDGWKNKAGVKMPYFTYIAEGKRW